MEKIKEIRPATAADAAAIRAIYAPYVERTAISFEYETPSEAEFCRRIEQTQRQFPFLVWEEAGEVLGYAYGSCAFTRKAYGFLADLSIYLRQDVHGRGIGKKLYAVLEDLLRRQGYCRLYGLVVSENTSSCRFHEAMGYRAMTTFAHCGMKFGNWYNVIWYEKILRDGPPPKAFPVSWRALPEADG